MSTTQPDARISTYHPVVATTEFAANFPIFDNDDIKVFVDGVERDDFAVSAVYSEGVSTNARAVFGIGVVGKVEVVGARDPRRTNRFLNGAPLPIRDQNLALDTLQSEIQEARRDITRSIKAPYGSQGPTVLVGAPGQVPVFDGEGNLTPSTPNGIGNMIREIYDPQGLGLDVFDLANMTGVVPPGGVEDTSFASPSVIANRIADRCDVRDYSFGVNIFGQYAVEKIQAAIDADDSDLLLFPKGVIPITDSVIIWRPMTFRGVRDESYWHELGDSSGTPGTVHPNVGTVFWTEGAGAARRWTSMEDADDPINPMFVLLGGQVYMQHLSKRTGIRNPALDPLAAQYGLSGSAVGWHSARFIAGSRAHRNEYVSIQGEAGVGFEHAVYVDATNSKFNTALNSLPHYSKMPTDLMDIGPTDIQDRNCIYAGVTAFRVQGRTGSFPGGQNPYAPNGMSDMKIHAHFYADGPLATRQDHGALINIDYAMPSNWSDGSNGGQNASFHGRLDAGGKWSVKLKRCRGVRIHADYLETSLAYQAATPAAPRAIVQTDSAYSGDFAIICGKWFSNIRVDDAGTEATLANFSASPSLGRRLHFDGLESGESNTMLARTGSWTNNVIPQHRSTAASGEIRDVEVSTTGQDTFLRRRKRAAGKGEFSFDGASWFSYEEGTWTPVLRGATTPGANTYTSQAGSWRRNGNLVHVSGVIQINGSVDAAMAGQMQISGLPFTSRNNAGSPAAMVICDLAAVSLSASTQLVGYIAPNSSVIALSERGITGDASITATSKFGTNFRIRFEATYEVTP